MSAGLMAICEKCGEITYLKQGSKVKVNKKKHKC